MNREILTKEGIINTLYLLEDELINKNINREIALIYLTILYEDSNYNYVCRPFITYKLKKFDTYLRFFKQYNLLSTTLKSNCYIISDDLTGKTSKFIFYSPEAIEIFESIQYNIVVN